MKWLTGFGLVGLGLAVVGAALWTPDLDRAQLEQRYLRSPADLVTVDGVPLHVRDDGPRSAPALLLIHGFGSSLHTWEDWASALKADYRVIRIDLPGCGLSRPDPTGDYTDARTVHVLLALLDQLGVASTTVIGHSIGGRIAWTFAAQAPGRTERLVLLAPDGFATPGFEYGKTPEVPWITNAMKYVLPKWLLRVSLAPAYGDPTVMTDALATRYWELLRAPGVREATIARMAQTVRVNPVPLLRTIAAPTLLLWGTKDGMIPVTNADDYLAALPNARKVVMPGIGHLPQEEVPAESLVILRAFLAETASAAAAPSSRPPQ